MEETLFCQLESPAHLTWLSAPPIVDQNGLFNLSDSKLKMDFSISAEPLEQLFEIEKQKFEKNLEGIAEAQQRIHAAISEAAMENIRLKMENQKMLEEIRKLKIILKIN